jgi:hypothetical protein
MAQWLEDKGIPVTVISVCHASPLGSISLLSLLSVSCQSPLLIVRLQDAAVGYTIEQVDFVIVGAEAVVENGGIINSVTSPKAFLQTYRRPSP